MKRYTGSDAELTDLDWMRRYGRLSVPATALLLAGAALSPVHPALILLVALALAAQAAILVYATLRRRKLACRRRAD